MSKRIFNSLLVFICLLILGQYGLASADTAISVPISAKQAIDNAKNDWNDLKEKKREEQYKKDAAAYVEKMQQYYSQVSTILQKTVEDEAFIETAEKKAAIEVEHASIEKNNAQNQLSQAQSDYNEYSATINNAYVAAKAAKQNAALKMQQCYEREAQIQQEVDAANAAGKEITDDPANYLIDWKSAVLARQHAEQLQETADGLAADLSNYEAAVTSAQQALNVAAAQNNTAEQKLLKLTAAKNTARQNILIYRQNLQTAKKNLEDAIQKQQQLLYNLSHPNNIEIFSQRLNYYSWQDNYGNKGHQLTLPIYYGYMSPRHNYNVGIYTSLVNSSHDSSAGNNSISTSTDTSIELSKSYIHKKLTTKYDMLISLPTGQSSLNTKKLNTRMSDDLVESGQYGEGLKLRPQIELSRYTTDYDKYTIGSSYLWSQSYNQSPDTSDIRPGYEWAKWVRYQHAQDKWQLVSELSHTNYGRSTFGDGYSYHLDNGWEFRNTYNFVLKEGQELLVYCWLEKSGSNNAESTDNNFKPVYYYGTRWTKDLDKNHAFYIHLDGMNTNGNRYAGYKNDQYNEVKSRDKYTLGIGYQIKAAKNKTFDIDLQYFRMMDGASTLGEPPKSYHGINILCSYNLSI